MAIQKLEGIQNELLTRFPELQEGLERAFGSYYNLKSEIPDPYPVFGVVLRPLVFDLLRTERDKPLLRRIFAFLEEMALSPDSNVTDLLGIEVIEDLVLDRASIQRAWNYMGEKTKEFARETARYGGWQDNLPPDEPSAHT